MEEIFFNLFSQLPGTESGTQVALFSLSALLSVVAALLLAHRNDLGWWAQMLAVFAGPLVIALQYDLTLLSYALPYFALAAFGLWRFSRFEFQGKFTRKVTLGRFGLMPIILTVLGVLGLTALHLGEMLTTGFAFTAGTSVIWLSFVSEALVVTSFALIACGLRPGWLLMALASLVYVVTIFNSNPALALLGTWVFMVLASVYGWFAWRGLPTRGESAADAATTLETN
ncbi:nicotinamide mononucleotide transporter [Glutamicibacter sp. MNS18]|uniref:nicotinamide mononucleotide transporter n=1 Tax=Glutamicibacter sp. MNS18 TaxID=2989817 RepID=UPI002236BD47|nr:nicotinamide mononucleotide transporter [Glutamicibacter sp. MNS18]MCW4464054.1 nicotinamide mononucleotide transporter [Glutamicibacter sp. MNS18]